MATLEFDDDEIEAAADDIESADVEDIILSDIDEEEIDQNTKLLTIDLNSRLVSKSKEERQKLQKNTEHDSCTTQFHIGGADFPKTPEGEYVSSSEDLDISDDETHLISKITDVNSLESNSFVSVKSLNNPVNREKFTKEGPEECRSTTNLVGNEPSSTFNSSSGKKSRLRKIVDKNKKYFYTTLHGAQLSEFKPKSLSTMFDEFVQSITDENDDDVFEPKNSNLPYSEQRELLKSELDDDEDTDVEELIVGTGLNEETADWQNPECRLRHRFNRSHRQDGFDESINTSHSVEHQIIHTDEEVFSDEASFPTTRKTKKSHKRKSYQNEQQSDAESTEEEEIFEEPDIICKRSFVKPVDKMKEWTETDESGGVKQVTQIKTETSIKVIGGKEIPCNDEELLSFVEKRNFFQRLSLTSDNVPTTAKWMQDVSLDDIPMAQGEIVNEEISFEDRLKMFEHDEENFRRKIQKNGKQDQPTVYRYDFTKSGKEKLPTPSDLEKAEAIVQKVNDELVNDGDLISSVKHPAANESCSLEAAEQEVSTLLAEVDREEQCDDVEDIIESIISSENLDTGVSAVEIDDSEDFGLDERRMSDGAFIESPVSDQDGENIADLGYHEESNLEFEDSLSIREYSTSRLDSLEQSEAVVEEVAEKVIERTCQPEERIHEDNLHEDSSLVEMGISQRVVTVSPFTLEELHEEGTGCRDYRRESFREALELEAEEKLLNTDPDKGKIQKELPNKNLDISAVVKSQILDEELGQCIEDSPLEVKHISEEFEKATVLSTQSEDKVYKHIKTEIFSQELGEDIESGSPEHKDISPVNPSVDVVELFVTESSTTGDADENVSKGDVSSEAVKPEDENITEITDISDLQPLSPTENIEHDDLEEYEEAKDEHSLSEQLLALASNVSQPVKCIADEDFLDGESSSGDPIHAIFDPSISHRSSACRKGKETGFSRIDKKEIRSFKATKQVSTIEEHSSIESSDSPQELFSHDFSESQLNSYGVKLSENLKVSEAVDDSFVPDEIQNDFKQDVVTEVSLTSDIASTFDVTVESKTDLPHVFVSDDHKSDIESPEDEYPKKSDIESPEDDEYPKKSDIQSSEDHEPHSKKSDVESPIDLEHPSTKSDFELPKSHESKSDIESPEGHETKSDIESPEGHETMKLDTESPEDHDSSFKRSDIESPEDHELLFKKPDNQQTFGKPPSPPSDSKSSKDSKKSDSDNEGSKLPCAELLAPAKKDESFSSSGEMESHYYSAETSDSGKTPRSTPVGSRPCSSEFEVNVLSGQGSEYETCVTSQDGTGELSGSYSTAATSQETSYSTACSSFSHSSRESAYSVDSESSGHLASVEISSEASETLVPSAQEMELEFATELEMPVLDEEASSTALLLKEPYDMEIPESVIRSGVELPFFKNWDLQTRNQSEPRGETSQWPWHCPEQSESFTDYENTKPDDHSDTTPLIEGNAGSFEAFSLSSADRPTESACASQSSSFIQHAFTENSERKDANNKYNEKPCSGKAHSAFSSETQSLKHAYGISLETDDAVDPGGACVEEELSVSESSVTQSEQTWQTNSLDTAIQLSSHVPVSHVILDTQVATSFTDSLSDIPPEVTASLEHVSVSSEQHMPYLQLNGPIEVDYNPEYDAFEGDDSALPENPPQLGFQLDELQFELEEENDVPENHHAVANGIAEVEIEPEHDESHEDEDDHFNVDAENGEGSQFDGMPGSAAPNGVPVCVGRLTEAEKPEAQQQQAVGEFEDSLRSENVVFQDQTSYLPESDQENIRSLASENFEQEPSMSGQAMLQGVGDPDVDDAVEDAVEGAVEENISFEPKACSSESMDKAEVVDTFPEDERYDCLFQKPDATDVKASPSSDISETNDLLESDAGVYLDPPSDLYTHHEEDDMELKESDMFPSPIPEESKQSTPSFDALPGRKFFPRSGDTSAASSLQEFERLEADIAAGRCSQTSADSLEKATSGKSIESDDLARRMLLRSGETSAASSLLEFERLEADIAAGRISRASIDSCEKIISGKSLESDYLARRIIHRSEENSTASSLQEFERLEAEFAAGRVSRSSAESFEKPPTGKSSERDDISMSSLADFEKLEKEISEQEQTVKASAGEPVLSEVDEGLESQISDIQGLNADPEHADSDDSEYEKRMTEIEEAIQLAQTNVEKFHEETVEDLSEGMTYEEYTVTHTSDSSQKYTTDTDVETVANAQEFAAKSRKGEKSSDETEIHTDSSGADNGLGGQDDSSNSSKNGKGDCMISSTDSVDPSSSTATHATYQFETDSVMSSSINSTQASGEECTMVSSTDTLESETKITYSQGELGSEGDNANVAGGIVSESNFVQVSSYSCDIAEGLDKPQKMEMFLTNLTHKPIVPDDQTSSELVSSSLHSSSSPPTYADHLHKIGNTPAASAFDSGKDAPSTEISGLCQQDEDEGGDDVVSHTTTTTTRIVTTVTTDDGVVQEEQVTEGGDELRRSMEEVLNQFMTEDKTQDSEKH